MSRTGSSHLRNHGDMKDMRDKRQTRCGRGFLFFSCALLASVLMCGCSQLQTGPAFREANDLFGRGDYRASLAAYERILQAHPGSGDRALFEMGIIHAHPKNGQKDYQKSLACFQRLIREYPESPYRQESERMIFYIDNAVAKDAKIASQQAQIAALQQEARSGEEKIASLQKKIAELGRTSEKGPADRILIEKKARRMTLFSSNRVIRTYRIALGGNPVGPKERQGDNKTPEGTYLVDARNKDSLYHIALHISYPNENDRRRARRLGVSPGGGIMIHGIKAGFAEVGELHTGYDWTRGCIAVTDEEIEEIDRLVPDGTIVEIRP
jgi:L,D-peptidoglycan transpeptidase YkuD (ErfK/YbiS/YcfS/YnhG family)